MDVKQLMVLSGNPVNFSEDDLQKIRWADWYDHVPTGLLLIDTSNLDIDGGLMEGEFTAVEDAGIASIKREDLSSPVGLAVKRWGEEDGFYYS